MNTYDHLRKGVPLIEAQINYTFKEKALIELAFIHRSFTNENRDVTEGHNERLEFLGDAILGLIVSDFLYNQFPDRPEGELSYLRSCLVEAPACTLYLQKINLEKLRKKDSKTRFSALSGPSRPQNFSSKFRNLRFSESSKSKFSSPGKSQI